MNIKDILYGKPVRLSYSYNDIENIDWKDIVDYDFVTKNSNVYQHNFKQNYEKTFKMEYKLFHIAYKERRDYNRENQIRVPEYGITCPTFINYMKDYNYYSPNFIPFYMFLKKFNEVDVYHYTTIYSTRLIWPEHGGPYASFYMFYKHNPIGIGLTHNSLRLIGEWSDTYVLGVRPL